MYKRANNYVVSEFSSGCKGCPFVFGFVVVVSKIGSDRRRAGLLKVYARCVLHSMHTATLLFTVLEQKHFWASVQNFPLAKSLSSNCLIPKKHTYGYVSCIRFCCFPSISYINSFAGVCDFLLT